jgi:hypothetical protein
MSVRRRTKKALIVGALMLALVGAAGSTGAAPGNAAVRRVPPLGRATVLMIDSHRIEATTNISRQYYQGRKIKVDGQPTGRVELSRVTKYVGANDAADGDKDVDSTLLDARSILYENGHYRMWLRSGPNVGYRESDDGIHWHVRDPDSVILVAGVSGGSVVKDPSTGLYYLLGWSRAKDRYVEMVSPDGLQFERTSTFAGRLAQVGSDGDVITASTDPVSGTLVVLAKQRTAGTRACRGTSNRAGGRTFGVNTSGGPANARFWRRPRVVVTSDCTDALSVPRTRGTSDPVQLYGAAMARYGDQYLVFPWLFHVTKTEQWGDGTIDTQIASTPSISKIAWTRAKANVKAPGGRLKRPVVIQRGPNGSWDDGMVFGVNLFTSNGVSRLYYNGWDSTHYVGIKDRKMSVGIVEWKQDRFMGLVTVHRLHASTVRTRAFRMTGQGRTLHVNVSVRAGRSMRAEVLDARTGRVLTGWSRNDSTFVRGDQTDGRITWGGKSLGRLGAKPIKIRFIYTGSFYAWAVR